MPFFSSRGNQRLQFVLSKLFSCKLLRRATGIQSLELRRPSFPSKAIDRKPDASISEEDEVLEHASKSLKTLAHSRYQNWRLQNGNIDRAVLDP
jgi:hypothetical protein